MIITTVVALAVTALPPLDPVPEFEAWAAAQGTPVEAPACHVAGETALVTCYGQVGGAVLMATASTNLATGTVSTFTEVPVIGHVPANTTTTLAPTTTVPEWEERCPGPARQVVYHGDGDATHASFTLAAPGGTQQGDYSLPLRQESGALGLWFCAGPGEFIYVSLQNPSSTGSVRCEIVVDGVTVSEIESTGAYVIATCDGVVP